MERTYSHLEEIDMIGKLADLKDQLEHDNLLLNTIIALLIDKGIVSQQEITDKSKQLTEELDESLLIQS